MPVPNGGASRAAPGLTDESVCPTCGAGAFACQPIPSHPLTVASHDPPPYATTAFGLSGIGSTRIYGIRGCTMYPLGIETVIKSGRWAPTGVPQPDTAQSPSVRVTGSMHCVVTVIMSAVRPVMAGVPLPSVGPVSANWMDAVMVGSPASGQKVTPFCTASKLAMVVIVFSSE